MRASAYVDALRETLCADLDFHGTDGNYGPHAWHPFPAKFPPQLPNFLIKQLSKPGDVVLDPMLGSGTTLVEAVRLGRRAIGCDIDPLARMIAGAKLTPINPSTALQTGLSILTAAQSDCWQDGQRLRQDFQLRFDRKTADFIDYWFLPQHQIELFSLLQRIEELPQGRHTRVSQRGILFDYHRQVWWSFVGARSCAHASPQGHKKAPGSTFIEFSKRLERNIAAIGNSMPHETERSSYPSVNGVMDSSKQYWQAEVRAASAADTGLPTESVDLIVTSPPYANNAIDYMRAHKFSLVWFGGKSLNFPRSGLNTWVTMPCPTRSTETCPTSAK